MPNSWIISIVPLMSTASVWSISSSVISRQESCSEAMSPTLLISTSRLPSSASTVAAIRLMSSQLTMSPWTSSASAPAPRTRSAVASAPADELR